MADTPQIEDGYTKIANELLDAMCAYFPGGGEGQILLCVIRKTYGWGKKADAISIGQFQEATGLSRRTVIYALQNLEAKNMISVAYDKTGVKIISFQKNYSKWIVQNLAPQVAQNRARAISNKGAKPCTSAKPCKKGVQNHENDVQSFAPTKETKTTKETITKKSIGLLPLCRAWKAFVEMRKKIKKPMTEYAMELRVGDLRKLVDQGEDPVKVLDQSTGSDWQDLYPVKDKKPNLQKAPQQEAPKTDYACGFPDRSDQW
jgi:phage replication O-like protein O